MIIFLMIGLALTSMATSTPKDFSKPTTEEIYRERGGTSLK